MKTHYELLEITIDAPPDEIKRAFRREIAKYHPDKVQHLGKEFQEIAATKAAALTDAYKTLSNADLRAEYDATLNGAPSPAPPAAPKAHEPPAAAPRQAAPPPPFADGAPPRTSQFSTERQGVTSLMRRATLVRFQGALAAEFARYDELRVPGFDVAVALAGGFWPGKAAPFVLVRVVETVDRATVAEAWALAAKWRKDGAREVCVFLMGPALAPASELAAAIAEQRRRPLPGGVRLVLIPVNTRDWTAHVPTDAPKTCKSLLARLQTRA